MPEISTILTIFDKILNLIGLIREGKIQRDNKIESALHALYTALAETKVYVLLLKNRNPGHDTFFKKHYYVPGFLTDFSDFLS